MWVSASTRARENILPGRTQQLPNEEVIVSPEGQRSGQLTWSTTKMINRFTLGTGSRDSWKDMKGRAGPKVPHQMSSFIETLEN